MKRISFTFAKEYSAQMMSSFLLAINQGLESVASTAAAPGESASTDTARRVIDSTVHNFPLGRGTYFELSSVGPDAGMTGIAGGTDGRLIILRNVGINSLPLFHDSNSSVVGNRIKTRTGATAVIAINGGLVLVYDGAQRMWIPTGSLP